MTQPVEQHIVLLATCGTDFLRFIHAARLRDELSRLSLIPRRPRSPYRPNAKQEAYIQQFPSLSKLKAWDVLYFRFEGIKYMDEDFIKHSIGVLYWHYPVDGLKGRLKMLGLAKDLQPVMQRGLQAARNEIGEARRDLALISTFD